jgi:hypothetical protein
MKNLAGLAIAAGFALLNNVQANQFLVADSEPFKPMMMAATNWTLTAPATPADTGYGMKSIRDYAMADGSLTKETSISMSETSTNNTYITYVDSTPTTTATTSTTSTSTANGATTTTTTYYGTDGK